MSDQLLRDLSVCYGLPVTYEGGHERQWIKAGEETIEQFTICTIGGPLTIEHDLVINPSGTAFPVSINVKGDLIIVRADQLSTLQPVDGK